MRRTLEETRALLLRTGVGLLHDRGLFVAVTHVRLSDVAKAADLTTGAAYRVWERQEDFHRDLAVAAVRYRSEETLHRTIQQIHAAVDGGAPLSEVLRIGALAQLQVSSPTDPFQIALGLRMLSGAVAEVAEASRQRHAESTAAFGQLYDAMLNRYDRRMRAPLDVQAMADALAALTEGFALQSLSGLPHPTFELDDLPDGVGREWTLIGLAIEGIVERLTEPRPPAAAS